MKFSEWKKLLEKRKNPEQNPKISTYEALKPFFKEENIFVSFTDLDKLGINPQSDYNTPIGIYSYPLKQMYEKNQKEWNIHKKVFFPFASNRPYIWVFKPKSNTNIMELSEYSSKDFDRDINKLQKMGYNVDKYIDKMKSEAKHNSPAGFFWYITMSIIKENYDSFKQRTIKWNALFRELGYDGFTDKTGMGIIHESEPMQAVFFKKDVVEIIDKVLNKYYGKDVESELKNEIKNIKTSKDIDNYLKKYGDFIGEMDGRKKSELEKIVISHGNPELYWRLSLNFAFTKHLFTNELYMDAESIIKHEAIDIIKYEDRINENQLLRILFDILTWDKKNISDNFLNQFFDYFNIKNYDYIIYFFPGLCGEGMNKEHLLKFIQNKNNKMDKKHFSKLLNIFYDSDRYKYVIEYILSLNYDFREDVKNILKNKDIGIYITIILNEYLNKNIKESVKITDKRKENLLKVYHGDNFGLTHINKNYDRIADPKGNMANGLGIYFAKDVEHAKRYGNKIVSTEVDINKLLPAKEYLDDYISADKMARLLHYFYINSEEFWMNYADYGFEVIEKEDYKKHYSYEMAEMIIEEQVRNVMIDLWQKVRDTEIFVEGWLKYIGYYGTYEKIDNDIVVALIYNEKPVEQYSEKSLSESKENHYILLLDEYETIKRGNETYYWDDDKKDITGDRPEKYRNENIIDKNSINKYGEIIRKDYLESLPYLAGEEITISKEIEYITLNDEQIDILVNENYPEDFDYNDYISEVIENGEIEYETIQEEVIKISDPADEIEEMYNEIKEYVNNFKNLELSISEARTTNSIYITVTNIENDNSIIIRISDHSSNLDNRNDYNLLTSQNFKRGFEDVMFSVDSMDDVYFGIKELSGEESIYEKKEFKNFSEWKKSFREDVDSDRGYINIARGIWDSIFTTGENYEKYFDFENNCFTIPLATFMGSSAKNQILKIKFRNSERMGGSAGWYKNLNDNVHEIAIGYNRKMMDMYVSDNSGYDISNIHLVKKFDKFKKYIYKEKIFKNFRNVFVHEFKHLINFLRFKGGKEEYEKAKEYNPNKQTMLQAYVKSEQEYDSYFMNLISFIEENIYIDYISSFEYLLKRIKEEMNKNYPAGRIAIDYYILFVEWRKKTLRRLYQHFKQWKKEKPTPKNFPGFPEEEGNTLPKVEKEFKNFSEWKKLKHLTK